VNVRRIREITIQTSETFVLRLNQPAAGSTCATCSGVELLTPEAAGVLFGVPLRWIFRNVENGELHFRETSGGSLLVCPASLRLLVAQPGSGLGSQQFKTEEK
jgi:hypothetical protein